MNEETGASVQKDLTALIDRSEEAIIRSGATLTQVQVSRDLSTLFGYYVGDQELEIFHSTILPRLEALYGRYPKKMAQKGIDILRKVIQCEEEAEGIAHLMGAIPEDSMRLVTERQALVLELTQKIQTLLQEGQVSGRPHNVLAVIIVGSWAWESFDKESDIDVIYIVSSGDDVTGEFDFQLRDAVSWKPRIERVGSYTMDYLDNVVEILPPRWILVAKDEPTGLLLKEVLGESKPLLAHEGEEYRGV